MDHAIKTLFLPGATGSASFWKPVAGLADLDGTFFNWPGLGDEPAHPDVNEIDDLVTMVLRQITEPVNLVAQSMGGLIAIKVALAAPRMINRLVLAVTSGGVPVSDLGGLNWRLNYIAKYPNAASWIADPTEDLSDKITTIGAPSLLLWGDNDPISPVAVGQRLMTLLQNAHLNIITNADHDLAQTHAKTVAEMIKRHFWGKVAGGAHLTHIPL